MAMKKKIPNTINKDAVLTETYETEIEFTCPVRGLVKQKVKVKKYASVETKEVPDVRLSTNITDILDTKYSGLILNDDVVDDEESP